MLESVPSIVVVLGWVSMPSSTVESRVLSVFASGFVSRSLVGGRKFVAGWMYSDSINAPSVVSMRHIPAVETVNMKLFKIEKESYQ